MKVAFLVLGLIIPRGQSLSGHVVQAKMCVFPPVRLEYVTEVNYREGLGKRRTETRQVA